MHPMRHPAYAVAVGVLFIVLGIAYYAIPAITGGHVDWAGMVMAGMGTDVSWRRPARKMAALYRDLLAPTPTADAGTPP